ncbi:type II toxin-antitoxin system VapC family toxin [Mucilaginibacter sp. UYCu711]|uniref:type II toxin-antitoxin system VapC family toxin n=1 Tax=Mucilaginibacter sp. UYCu711 TaxID=3156339 RepID=UPI003D261878
MGTGYLIDTNVVIGYLDQTLPPKGMEIMNDIINETPKISVITKIEVLRYNTTVDGYKIINDFISESNVLHLNDQVIDKTIEICKSKQIKLPDAIIAATALVNNFALATRNISDFKNIQGLELLNPWAEDNGRAL